MFIFKIIQPTASARPKYKSHEQVCSKPKITSSLEPWRKLSYIKN